MQTTPRGLTHPGRFELPERSQKRKGARGYSEGLSQRVLDAQQALVEQALSGQVDEDRFVNTALALESVEGMHAQLRPDGFTGLEKKRLEQALRDAPLSEAPSQNRELRTLYQDLLWSEVPGEEMTEELQWRSQREYGKQLSQREGTVFQEERSKLRAYLFDGHGSERAKPSYDGPYHKQLPQLLEKAIGLFPLLDENQDQIVDRNEARALLTFYDTLELTPAEAATLYSRQKNLASAVEPDNSGENLKLEDLEALLPENWPTEMSEDFKKALYLTSTRLRAQLRSKTPEPSPFTLGPTTNPLKVQQGREGSCWLLCNLPPLQGEQLDNLIKTEGDGYRVTLPDGRTTEVEPLNEAERRVYSQGDGAWSGALEKGLAQIFAREGEDINGGHAMKGRELLSGRVSERHYFDRAPSKGQPDLRDPKTLLKKVQDGLENGAVMAAALKSDHSEGISKISASGHAYTVVGLDQEKGTVAVRNPWGRGENADRDGDNDGVFELTTQEFFGNFSYIYTDKIA